MAVHTKTVEYALTGVVGPQTAATLLTFATLAVDIPETSSRTFKSVTLVLSYTSSRTTSTTSTTAPTASVKLGAATATNFTVGIDTTNGITYVDFRPLEHWLDATAHFVANYSGTTQNLVVTFQSPVATQNISAKVIITYEYDDTNDTRLKTVRIPLEGGRAVLTGSLATIGSATEIPNLSTFLPESTVTVKDIFFEIQYATRNPGAITTTSVALDAEGATALGAINSGGTTAGDVGFAKFIWKRTDMTTSATHAFKASSNQTNGTFEIAAVLVVTYSYVHSTSSTLLNSVIIPFDIPAFGEQDITGSTNDIVYGAEFWIEEPATITLLQSAVRIGTGYQQSQNAGDAILVKVGSQAGYTSYASPMLAGFVTAYGIQAIPLQIRFDSAASAGSGLSLARGKNTLTFSMYANGTFLTTYNQLVVTNAVIYLNYTSAKAPGGDGYHNRTIWWLGQTDIANALIVQATSVAFTIAESTLWWNNGYSPMFKVNEYDGFELRYQVQPGEGLGDGWGTAASYVLPNWATRYETQQATLRSMWDRYYNDLDTSRINPFGTRSWRFSGSAIAGISVALGFYMTYHAITFSGNGNASAYAGAGSGITINLHRSDTGELVISTTTSAGGNFSFTWWDNTIDLLAEAQQDATHVGRSANNKAS